VTFEAEEGAASNRCGRGCTRPRTRWRRRTSDAARRQNANTRPPAFPRSENRRPVSGRRTRNPVPQVCSFIRFQPPKGATRIVPFQPPFPYMALNGGKELHPPVKAAAQSPLTFEPRQNGFCSRLAQVALYDVRRIQVDHRPLRSSEITRVESASMRGRSPGRRLGNGPPGSSSARKCFQHGHRVAAFGDNQRLDACLPHVPPRGLMEFFDGYRLHGLNVSQGTPAVKSDQASRRGRKCCLAALSAVDPLLELLHVDVEHGRDVQRERLGEHQPAHHGQASGWRASPPAP